jgi:DNA-binding NarL/FixJ family response regulator
MSLRLVIAHSHWLIRAGLRAALQAADPHTDVVGEASDATAAVQCTRATQPDLVLIDEQLPDTGGLVAAQSILAERRDQKILLMAEQGSAQALREVLRAGCCGLVRTSGGDLELTEALRCMRLGGIYLAADQARLLAQVDAPAPAAGPLTHLSPRELTVFRLIAQGHTNRATGANLQLSPKTVEKHRASLMHKLKLRSAVDLRLLALELGVVQRAPAGLSPQDPPASGARPGA